MARPISSAKQSVNLTPDGPRVSRIRRDPPPAVKPKLVVPPDESDQWVVIVGILVFALAIFAITLAFSSYSAWSAQNHAIEVRIGE